jgi:hypothetical protein
LFRFSLAQVRHEEAQKPAKCFRISLDYRPSLHYIPDCLEVWASLARGGFLGSL